MTPVQSKDKEVITIRITVTTTVKIERTTETKESTERPVIVLVLVVEKANKQKPFRAPILTQKEGKSNSCPVVDFSPKGCYNGNAVKE